jgi:two-component system, chemotaxis family, chemotaxis protein CheY
VFQTNAKILIVDDMTAIRDLVKNQLAAMGYKNVLQAVDGEEALRMLMSATAEGIPFELVISDWNMPRMKGIDFLKKVRAVPDWEQLPFVLLTSESERDQVTEAVMSGVSQYIVKPFSGKIFEEKLRAAWTKHNPKKK